MKEEDIKALADIYGITNTDVVKYIGMGNQILAIASDYPSIVALIRKQNLSRREQIYLSIFVTGLIINNINNKQDEEQSSETTGTPGQVQENPRGRKGAAKKKGADKTGHNKRSKKDGAK